MAGNGTKAELKTATLVVDGLNWLERFVPTEEAAFEYALPPALLAEANRRVFTFTAAAVRSNIRLIFVFDKGQATEEAREKWTRRRCEEVLKASRPMPCNVEVYFTAILETHGCLCLRPPDMDGDDAAALLAWKLGAAVLSRDRDFLRYDELPTENVFRDFGIDETNKLRVERQMAPLPAQTTRRTLADIEHHLPDDLSDLNLVRAWGAPVPLMCQGGLKGETKRGNADEHTAALGNLNCAALGLVGAVYHKLKIHPSTPVCVSLPEAVRDSSGTLSAVIAANWVKPTSCEAKAIVANSACLAKEWLCRNAHFDELPSAGPEHDLATNVRLLKRKAGRAHAVCALASEISDAHKYANGETEQPYSSAQRQHAAYWLLVADDPVLNPCTQEWFCDMSEEEQRDYLKKTKPHGVGTGWCPVVKCTGLYGGRVRCKAATEADGYCFLRSIAHASARNKNPLCNACVLSLSCNSARP